MKRKYTLIIIVFILIISYLVVPLISFSQKEETKTNYRKTWLDMTSNQKECYLVGFRDGMLQISLDICENGYKLPDLSDTEKEMISDYYYKKYVEFAKDMSVYS